MKKIGLIFKETSEKQIQTRLKDSQSFLLIGYSKINSPALTTLRMSLKAADASLCVVKNSVARRALKDCRMEGMLPSVEGPCAFIFTKDEPVNASRVLYDFYKTNENLKIATGFFQDKVLEKKDIERLAKLPGREVLRAQVVMTLNSPLSRLAMALNSNLRKLVCVLDQIKNKRG
jgi:large subunit ribosomal protein L10